VESAAGGENSAGACKRSPEGLMIVAVV